MEDKDNKFSENFEKNFEENFEKNFKENFKEGFRSLNEKLSKMGEEFDKAFGKLGEIIAEKTQSAVEDFVSDNERRFARHGDRRNRKPVYEFHKDGVVTQIFDDGTKKVNVEKVNLEKDETENGVKRAPETKGDKILKIVPFLDEDSLHELTQKFIDGELEIDMKKVLPYLGEDDVALLMRKISSIGGEPFNGITLEDLLPYADDEEIGELFKAKARQGIIDEKLLDFVDEDCFHDIVVEYCNDENSALDIDKIYPYLEDEDFNLLFKAYLKRK